MRREERERDSIFLELCNIFETRRQPSEEERNKTKSWRPLPRASRCACAPAYAGSSTILAPSPPLLRRSAERPPPRRQGHRRRRPRRQKQQRRIRPRPPMPPPPHPPPTMRAPWPTFSWALQASGKEPTRPESPTRWAQSTSAPETWSALRSRRAASSASRYEEEDVCLFFLLPAALAVGLGPPRELSVTSRRELVAAAASWERKERPSTIISALNNHQRLFSSSSS